jgi:hypothetical protein
MHAVLVGYADSVIVRTFTRSALMQCNDASSINANNATAHSVWHCSVTNCHRSLHTQQHTATASPILLVARSHMELCKYACSASDSILYFV